MTQRILNFLRHAQQHRSLENTRSNRHHTYAIARQVTRHGQRQPDYAGLGGAIRGLANLAVIGSNRCGVNDHTTLAAG